MGESQEDTSTEHGERVRAYVRLVCVYVCRCEKDEYLESCSAVVEAAQGPETQPRFLAAAFPSVGSDSPQLASLAIFLE